MRVIEGVKENILSGKGLLSHKGLKQHKQWLVEEC
jgi:hypothetical protein